MSDDRAKKGLASFVRGLFPTMQYLGRFPSKIVQQNADGTLELQPDDNTVPAPSKVPIRLGLPGASVKVQAGGRILLGFEGGDPRQPIAELWDMATVTELKLDASNIILNGGTLQVARQSDAVGAAASMQVWISSVTTALNSLAPGSAVPPTDFGTISGGASGVKA